MVKWFTFDNLKTSRLTLTKISNYQIIDIIIIPYNFYQKILINHPLDIQLVDHSDWFTSGIKPYFRLEIRAKKSWGQ
jgi:hypothetical protein